MKTAFAIFIFVAYIAASLYGKHYFKEDVVTPIVQEKLAEILPLVEQPAEVDVEPTQYPLADSDVITAEYQLYAKDDILHLAEVGQLVDIDHPEGSTYQYRVIRVQITDSNMRYFTLHRTDDRSYHAVTTINGDTDTLIMTLTGRDQTYSIVSTEDQTTLIDQNQYREIPSAKDTNPIPVN